MADGKGRAGKQAKPPIAEDVIAGLIERGKDTPGFDPEDKSTWPDFYWKEGRLTARQEQEAARLLARHWEYEAITNRMAVPAGVSRRVFGGDLTFEP